MWLLAALMMQTNHVSIYVATDGNDGWSGAVAQPNPAKTDGPVATVPAAQRRARARAGSQVVIEPGTYRIAAALEFGESDSNTSYVAQTPGDAVIVGSRRVTGWTLDQRGWWHARLPGVASGAWNFCQLWVNGERRFRPRAPSAGYRNIADKAPPSAASAGRGFDRFAFSPGDLDPAWHNLDDVDLLAFHQWSMARMRIKSIDTGAHVLTLTGPSGAVADWAAFPKGNRYIVENVREAMGNAGEWYLDRPSGELIYVPMPGETPSATDVEVPLADSLIHVKGAKELEFKGLGFEYTNWNTPPQGHDYSQADIDVPGALTVEGSTGCRFDQCTVAHTGGYAVDLSDDCYQATVANSSLFDLGGGGVKIGTFRGHAGPAPNEDVVDHCRIVGGGRLHPASVGVWIANSAGNTVSHNEIRDFYYTAVSVGWTWGYAPTYSGNNHIVDNLIVDIGQHVLSDMGGIYTLGDQTGTVLSGNVIRNVTCFSYGGWGIYPDEGSSHETIENNIVSGCQSAGFHQHYGRENVVRNNTFALNGDYEVMRTRAEDHLSFTFAHNIIAWAGGQPFGGNWTGTGFEMKQNLYWHYGGMVSAPTQEPGGLVSDPLFVDPTQGNFKLKPGSPAFGLGFQQFYTGEFGPHGFTSPRPVQSAPRAFPDPFALHP